MPLKDGWFLTVAGPYIEVETFRVVALLGSFEVVVSDGQGFGVFAGEGGAMRVLWHEQDVTRREVEVRLRSRRHEALDGFRNLIVRAVLKADDGGAPWPLFFPRAEDLAWGTAALDGLLADGVVVAEYGSAGNVARVRPNREQTKET